MSTDAPTPPQPTPTERKGGLPKVVRRALALVALALAVCVGRYLYWAEFQHRFLTISDGRVYQSAKMSGEEMLTVVEEHGIKTVIDLRDDDRVKHEIEEEGRVLGEAGIRYVNLPTATRPDETMVAEFTSLLDEVVEGGEPFLIHCEHGEGRSVLYSGLYRVRHEDWDAEDALAEMVRLPPDLRWLNAVIPGLAQISPKGSKGQLFLDRARQFGTVVGGALPAEEAGGTPVEAGVQR